MIDTKQILSEEIANPTNEHQPFEERLEQALADDQMHTALNRFAPSWRASRGSVFTTEESDYGPDYSFAHLRSELRQAKDYAIEHQPEVLAQFKAQAEAVGVIVYEARTAEDANRYIYELCHSKGIDLVVKSKTMVSEETELNYYLEAQARWRSLPAFARKPLRNRVKGQVSRIPARSIPTMTTEGRPLTVCYFAGCMTDRLFPEMGEAVIKVLEAYGVRVSFPPAQNCCGLPALNSGDRRDGARMARQTIAALEKALRESAADYIISASTSCVATIIQDYIKLFEDLQQSDWLERTKALANKVMDFTHFMERVTLANGATLPRRSDKVSPGVVVTYHDSCQSCNCLNLRPEARRIIQDVLGLELREMPLSDVCCGFGGSTSIEHPEVAKRLLNNKLNNAQSTGASLLVADNPGCLMHLRGGVDASGRKMRVLHLAQLIAEYLPE